MKKRTLSLFLVLALICSLFSSAAFASSTTNLVTNGDFETGDSTGWYAIGNASVVTGEAHSGTYAAKVQTGCSYEQSITVQPNTKYVLVGWAKSESTDSVMTLGVREYGGTQTFSTTVSSSYEKLTVTFTTGANATSAIIFGYRQNAGSGAGFFDDVEVFEVDDFSPYQGLSNAVSSQTIPTYDGNNQPTHPSVIKFDTPWNGYTYWMAMTPYPYNSGYYEDPSIVVSNDGINWVVPEGVTNPLCPRPNPGHNCDVDLVYVEELDELWMYYVEADDVQSSRVRLLRTSDGVNWTGPQTVIEDPNYMYSILSPSIEILPNGTWMMWYVDTGNAGWAGQNNQVKYRTSSDGLTWSGPVTCDDFVQPGYQVWHIDVHYDESSGQYYAMFPAYPNGTNCDYCVLFFAVNPTGGKWEFFNDPILKANTPGSWDDFCIYRSSMLIEDDGTLRVWYGDKKQSDASWHIGETQRNFAEFMALLEA